MKVDLENWQVKQLREYFGHNDKTQIAHWAYTVFDKAHKKQLTLTDVVSCGQKYTDSFRGLCKCCEGNGWIDKNP